MPEIQNQKTIKEIRLAGGLGILETPKSLSNQVVPVFNVNPKDYRVINVIKDVASVTTGDSTVYTTPADKDFFLSSYILSTQADVTADSTFVKLQIIQDGTAKIIALMRKLTLTTFSGVVSMNLMNPIKVDRGTAITITQTFTVGASTVGAVICGYELDTFETL